MYAQYQLGRSLAKVGEFFSVTASAVHMAFARYDLPCRSAGVIPRNPPTESAPLSSDSAAVRTEAEAGSAQLLAAIERYNDKHHPGWRDALRLRAA